MGYALKVNGSNSLSGAGRLHDDIETMAQCPCSQAYLEFESLLFESVELCKTSGTKLPRQAIAMAVQFASGAESRHILHAVNES